MQPSSIKLSLWIYVRMVNNRDVFFPSISILLRVLAFSFRSSLPTRYNV